MNDLQKFVVAVIGGVAAIVIGILALTNPPIIALADPYPILFIVGGFAVLGVPLNVGLQAARTSTAQKAGK